MNKLRFLGLAIALNAGTIVAVIALDRPSPDELPPVSASHSHRVQAADSDDPRRDYSEIAALSLFGKTAPKFVSTETSANPELAQDAQATDLEDLPESDLRLSLAGVVFTPGEQAARVIIGASGNQEKYAVGDKLPGGSTIDEIHPKVIVIRRNGKREVVRFDQPDSPALKANPRKEAIAQLNEAAGALPSTSKDNAASSAHQQKNRELFKNARALMEKRANEFREKRESLVNAAKR
ncbi:MAG: type II secretion system protein N [Pseudomonadota bacterium]